MVAVSIDTATARTSEGDTAATLLAADGGSVARPRPRGGNALAMEALGGAGAWIWLGNDSATLGMM